MRDYFAESEFTRLTPPCKKSDMDDDFMLSLNAARHIAGIKFVLTSAYRTPEWELSKGRKPDGSHTTGKAVDIVATTSVKRFTIIQALMRSGFHRIGINFEKGFIHVDNDRTKPPGILFGY